MSDLERKFLFVTGKGGVGKTTLSVSLARALAQTGRRVLVAVSDGVQAGELFGIPELGTELTEVSTGLFAVTLESEAALREYGSMMLRSEVAYRALFENRVARSFLAAVPGLYQWAVLGKAWFHSQEKTSRGAARFDSVIFDAPATGHALQMLRVPKVITAAATPGPLRRDAELAWSLLQSPVDCAIVLATLPEELPILETLDLLKELQDLGLAASRIVLNGLMPAIFEPADAAQLTAVSDSETSPEAHRTLQAARDRAAIEHLHRLQQARLLTASPVPVTTLPWTTDASRPSGIATLANVLSPLLSNRPE